MEKERLIALVQAAQQGSDQAFTDLYEAFHQDLYYHIYKTVNDAPLAEDLLQDTFIEICQTIGQLKEPAAFVTWSKQIAYHRCTGYFKKRREVLADEDEDGYSVFDTIEEERTEFIPHEALDKEDLKQTIHGIIATLPPEQRNAILLRYFDEISVQEIAQIQGVSEGTVKSRLNYGRKSIKDGVERYEKKTGVKLRCAGVVPLLLWLFREYALANKVSLTAANGSAAYTAATATTAATAAPVAAGTVTAGAKAAGGLAVKKVIAGIVAAAVVTGGAVVGVTQLKKDPEPTAPAKTQAATEVTETAAEPAPLPMDWLGYGSDGGINPRRFDLHIDQMSDTHISGHLLVSHIYKTRHDTDFTGTGVVDGDTVTYTLKFSVPVTFGTIVTYTYEELDLLYHKETDQFVFNFQYQATMDRVSTQPSPLIGENMTYSGIGEDNFYVGFTNENHLFELEIAQQREDAISGRLKVSYEGQVDHDTPFIGRGYRDGNKIYYEISLEIPRTETYILENTVDGFWLTYDLENDTFATEEIAPMYEFELTKNN